jgi:hypothetical protein
MSVHNGDPASLLAYLNTWAVSFTRSVFDATALTDTQRKWATGVRDVTGSFTGFMDDATSQTYLAAVDGLPRNMYLYPDAANMGQYISGSVLPDLAVTGGTAEAVAITVNWAVELGVSRTDSFGTYLATYLAIYT